jgi:hypothetical protein
MLLGLAVKHPVEFYDRASTILEVRWERMRVSRTPCSALNLTEALHCLETALGKPVKPFDQEDSLSEIETCVLRRLEDIKCNAPFSLAHNGDITLARCCYLLCRTLKPAVVLETGVAYGTTSAFSLAALHQNSTGELWSIDLPPLGREADRYVGALIPQPLKGRWHLHRGPSKRILPPLLKAIGGVDLFIHDSLHTYRSMLREFQAVWPFLRPGGVLIADDVGESSAFMEFARVVTPSFYAVVRQENKDSLFGVMLKTEHTQSVGAVPHASSGRS